MIPQCILGFVTFCNHVWKLLFNVGWVVRTGVDILWVGVWFAVWPDGFRTEVECGIYEVCLHNASFCCYTRVKASGPGRCMPRLALMGWPGLAPATELPVREWGDAVDVLKYITVLFLFNYYPA